MCSHRVMRMGNNFRKSVIVDCLNSEKTNYIIKFINENVLPPQICRLHVCLLEPFQQPA